MHKNLLAVPLLLVAIQNSYALVSDRPSACPSVSAIMSVGVHEVAEQSAGRLATEPNNSYGTDDSWSFAIGMFASEDDEVLLKQANSALQDLVYVSGPTPNKVLPIWICRYKSTKDDSIEAMAYTPAFGELQR